MKNDGFTFQLLLNNWSSNYIFSHLRSAITINLMYFSHNINMLLFLLLFLRHPKAMKNFIFTRCFPRALLPSYFISYTASIHSPDNHCLHINLPTWFALILVGLPYLKFSNSTPALVDLCFRYSRITKLSFGTCVRIFSGGLRPCLELQ